MTPQEEFLHLSALKAQIKKYNALRYLFPSDGPFRRELYPKHMEFFSLTSQKQIVAFMASNQSGKSTAGCYALSLFATGEYPDWWDGRKFTKAIEWNVAGVSSESVRNSLQLKLLGPKEDLGSGLIPKNRIVNVEWRRGTNDAVDFVDIQSKYGGNSRLFFMGYEQGPDKFMATVRDGNLLDEEPPPKIFTEATTRTITRSGLTMLTFTPVNGVTPLVIKFMPELGGTEHPPAEEMATRGIVTCGWDDVPHLSEKDKLIVRSQYSHLEMQARMTGIPSIGVGAVYPIDFNEVIVPRPKVIPTYHPRVYGMDPGGTPNGIGKHAALWAYLNRDEDCLYFYAEYYSGWKPPEMHASAIRARGEWIPGVSDDSVGLEKGESIVKNYRKLYGLKTLVPAQKIDRDARIQELLNRFQSGRARILNDCCPNLIMELRMHRQNDVGKLLGPAHLINCAEYIVQSGIKIAKMFVPKPTMDTTTEYRPWLQ